MKPPPEVIPEETLLWQYVEADGTGQTAILDGEFDPENLERIAAWLRDLQAKAKAST